MIHFINAFLKVSFGWKCGVSEYICLEQKIWGHVHISLFDASYLLYVVQRQVPFLATFAQKLKHMTTCEENKREWKEI